MEDVAVIYVDGQRLSGNLLLGMSFMRRLLVIIQDENNRSILRND
jgi:predicted aspartyl protease